MTIGCGPLATAAPAAGVSVVTTCCGVDCRFPAACASARSFCTAASTSCCCARKASPSCSVQSSFALIICSVCGTAVSAFTLGSQVCDCIASSSTGPFTAGLACDQRAASTTSSG